MVHRGLRCGWVKEPAQLGQGDGGIASAREAELLESVGQVSESHEALGVFNEPKLVGCGTNRAGLVRKLGVDATIDFVFERLHPPGALDGSHRELSPHQT